VKHSNRIGFMQGRLSPQVNGKIQAFPWSHWQSELPIHSHPDQPTWQGALNSTGFTHIALAVEDLDVAYQRLTEAGVIFNAPPQLSPEGYAKVTYGRAPEGVLLELVELLQQ